MNTIEGALSLDGALAQLWDYYKGKLPFDEPDSGVSRAAIDALTSLEWRVKHDGMSLAEAMTQLREHYARKMRESAGNRVLIGQLSSALQALGALEWHTTKGGK